MTMKRTITAVGLGLALLICFGMAAADPPASAPNDLFVDSGQRLSGSNSRDVALGDIDGRNGLDAFICTTVESYSGSPDYVWFNDGSGNFTQGSQAIGSHRCGTVALGNLDDEDGLDAVVTGRYEDPFVVWLNDGDGFFTESHPYGSYHSYGISLEDLDGDSDLDVMLVSSSGHSQRRGGFVWFNDGEGTFSNSGQQLGSQYSAGLDVGDLDGDGDSDAFFGNNGSNTVWWNDGSGFFIDSAQRLGSSNTFGVALIDVDGDSDLDAFTTNYGGGNKVWLNDGSGLFTDSGQSLGTSQVFANPAAEDLNGDGLAEVVVSSYLDFKRVWVNDGTGTFSEGQGMDSGSGGGVALGDLDGDGDTDAFFTNFTEPDTVWFKQCQKMVAMTPQLQTAGALVDIRYGDSNLSHGDTWEVIGGSSFQWRLKLNGFNSGWKSAAALCAQDLEITEDDYDEMTIDLPADLAAAGAEVHIRYSSFGGLVDGQSVLLPKDINVQWRLTVSGFSGPYQTKNIDGTDLIVDTAHYDDMGIELPSELSDAAGKVFIRYSSFGGLADGQSVLLPKDINVQWQLKVNGFSGPYQTKSVDGTDLTVDGSNYDEMSVNMPPDLSDAGAEVFIRYSSFGGLVDGQSVLLPIGINIQWQLKVNGFSGLYQTKSVDGTDLTVDGSNYDEMFVNMPPDLSDAGAEVFIRYSSFGGLVDGQSVLLPIGINIQWQLKVNGFSGPYQVKTVDGTDLSVAASHYCDVPVSMPPVVVSAGGQVQIRYSSIGWLDDGDTVLLPIGVNIQWQLKVNGFAGPWHSKEVDCSAILVQTGDYAVVTFAFDWTTNTRYFKTRVRYGPTVENGAALILPTGINIQARPVVYSREIGNFQVMTVDGSWTTATWGLFAALN